MKSLGTSFWSRFVSSEHSQLPHSHPVEGDRVPEAHGPHFGETADAELLQPAVAAFGVGEFGVGEFGVGEFGVGEFGDRS